MSQLDITQPFRDDVQERSVETYSSADERNDNPGLTCIIRFCYLSSPYAFSSPQENSPGPVRGTTDVFAVAAAGFSPQGFAGGILHPVYGCEVFVALDLCYFFDDGGVGVCGLCGFGVFIVGIEGLACCAPAEGRREGG